MQPIDSIETYVYVTGKDLVSGKEEIKKLIQKMINFDDVTKENIKKHNTNWPQILNHPCRILIIRGSLSEKTN